MSVIRPDDPDRAVAEFCRVYRVDRSALRAAVAAAAKALKTYNAAIEQIEAITKESADDLGVRALLEDADETTDSRVNAILDRAVDLMDEALATSWSEMAAS